MHVGIYVEYVCECAYVCTYVYIHIKCMPVTVCIVCLQTSTKMNTNKDTYIDTNTSTSTHPPTHAYIQINQRIHQTHTDACINTYVYN